MILIFWKNRWQVAGGHGKVIFHEKSSAKSENVMVSPKNFTAGSGLAPDFRPDRRLLLTQQRTFFDLIKKRYYYCTVVKKICL